MLEVNANRTRVLYRNNTEVGSTGAPCFDANWNLVALHLGGNADGGFGVPFATILAHLTDRGYADTLGGKEL